MSSELKYFKKLNTGDIAAGKTAEVEWAPEEDIKVGKIFVSERANQFLGKVFAEIKIGDVPITRPDISIVIFGIDYETAYPLNLIIKKGITFYWKITNLSGVTVNIDIIFEVFPG